MYVIIFVHLSSHNQKVHKQIILTTLNFNIHDRCRELTTKDSTLSDLQFVRYSQLNNPKSDVRPPPVVTVARSDKHDKSHSIQAEDDKIITQHCSCTAWYVLYPFPGLKKYPMYLFLTTDHGAHHYTLSSILLTLANLRCDQIIIQCNVSVKIVASV